MAGGPNATCQLQYGRPTAAADVDHAFAGYRRGCVQRDSCEGVNTVSICSWNVVHVTAILSHPES
jgi:hypothetical protein